MWTLGNKTNVWEGEKKRRERERQTIRGFTNFYYFFIFLKILFIREGERESTTGKAAGGGRSRLPAEQGAR